MTRNELISAVAGRCPAELDEKAWRAMVEDRLPLVIPLLKPERTAPNASFAGLVDDLVALCAIFAAVGGKFGEAYQEALDAS